MSFQFLLTVVKLIGSIQLIHTNKIESFAIIFVPMSASNQLNALQKAFEFNMACFTFVTFFVLLKKFFFLLGLAPFSVCRMKRRTKQWVTFGHSREHATYGIVLTIFSAVVSLYSMYLMFIFFYDGIFKLYKIVDLCLMSFSVAANLLIHFTYCLNSKEFSRIVEEIFNHYHSFTIDFVRFNGNGPILRFLMITFALYSLTGLFYILSDMSFWGPSLIIVMNFVPNAVVNWYILQYALVVKVLHSMFRSLNDSIDNSVKHLLKNFEAKNSLSNLTTHFDTFIRLSDLCTRVSNFYSFCTLFSITYMFLSVIGSIYFFLVYLVYKKSVYTSNSTFLPIPPNLLLVLLHILSVLSLTKNVTQLLSEVMFTYFLPILILDHIIYTMLFNFVSTCDIW